MFVYTRMPYYYETDQMKIVHHSNYIRWFEEARIAYFAHIGYDFTRQEQSGIVCPVLSVQAQYKHMIRFGDSIRIVTRLTAYNGIRYGFSYQIEQAGTSKICCTGTSSHCLLDSDGRIIKIRTELPGTHELLCKALATDAEQA
ncbi:MAG: acyl-CoA thioesterase [Oscillospiraceae bacterium]|nr:acyl-CoA thioesterase [Oscillospiraceae bacterium]